MSQQHPTATKSFAVHTRGEGPEGGDSHIKRTGGGASQKFWKKSLRGNKILFCGRGLKFFSPLRDTNSKTKHYRLSNFLRLSTRTGTAKAPPGGPFEAEHAKRYQIRFFNSYNELPRPFNMGAARGSGGHRIRAKFCPQYFLRGSTSYTLCYKQYK